jgi:hypothetical protein
VVFFVLTRNLCVIFLSYGVLYKNLYDHRLRIT